MCEEQSNCNTDKRLITVWCSGGLIQAGTPEPDVKGELVYNVKKRETEIWAEDGKGGIY